MGNCCVNLLTGYWLLSICHPHNLWFIFWNTPDILKKEWLRLLICFFEAMWNTYCVQSYVEESFSATSTKHMQDHFLGFLRSVLIVVVIIVLLKNQCGIWNLWLCVQETCEFAISNNFDWPINLWITRFSLIISHVHSACLWHLAGAFSVSHKVGQDAIRWYGSFIVGTLISTFYCLEA